MHSSVNEKRKKNSLLFNYSLHLTTPYTIFPSLCSEHIPLIPPSSPQHLKETIHPLWKTWTFATPLADKVIGEKISPRKEKKEKNGVEMLRREKSRGISFSSCRFALTKKKKEKKTAKVHVLLSRFIGELHQILLFWCLILTSTL